MVVVDVNGTARSEELVVQLVASTLRSQLRSSDQLTRIGRCAFAAAVGLEPGTSLSPLIEQRLAGAVRNAVIASTPQAVVRSIHVLAEPEQRLDADELLRRSLRMLHSGS
jgi:GGDEF domain-containing protein